MEKKLLFETDWLASIPIFFNALNGAAGSKIQSLLHDNADLSFHPEGLYNFLNFGYSVFGQTPLKNVRFLRHSSRLWQTESGVLNVEIMDDPFDRFESYRLSESDLVDLIRNKVRAWEASLPADQEIVLPLSGGFDSRLLLWCLREPSRVRAYTYGISNDQSRSLEVVHARALAERFGIRWEQIPLGDFHRYFEDWDAEFGVSTHAHGMYHFEFYAKIREKLRGKHGFLSGIIGDAWAGSIPPRRLDSRSQLVELGYTHGMRVDPSWMSMSVQHNLFDQFWTDHREQLSDYRFQVVTTIRLKIMLLSYLLRIPRLFNFEPWSPYLDIDVAMAMLNLPQERRVNRQWQRDFFVKNGLDLESWRMRSSRDNNLNIQAIKKAPLEPLNRDLLSCVIQPEHVDWINKKIIFNSIHDWSSAMCSIPKVGGVLRKLGLCSNPLLRSYFAYLCLKPLQSLLERNLKKL